MHPKSEHEVTLVVSHVVSHAVLLKSISYLWRTLTGYHLSIRIITCSWGNVKIHMTYWSHIRQLQDIFDISPFKRLFMSPFRLPRSGPKRNRRFSVLWQLSPINTEPNPRASSLVPQWQGAVVALNDDLASGLSVHKSWCSILRDSLPLEALSTWIWVY